MLSEEQIKKLFSANQSLRVQLEDANTMLAAREREIAFLSTELAESTALRSKSAGHLDEIESMRYRLGEKQLAAKGAEEREFELHQELTGMAILNKQYNELIQDYAHLQSQFKDMQAQFIALQQQNMQLEQAVAGIGELKSKLEDSLQQNEGLTDRINLLEVQKFLREI